MKCFSFLFSFILFGSSLAWATPATNLQLDYSLERHLLFINADHPTDRDRHYIQRVVVTRNSQDKQYFYFSHQGRADKFIADLDYTAFPGDHLDVELYCSQGGITRESIDIASPSTEKVSK